MLFCIDTHLYFSRVKDEGAFEEVKGEGKTQTTQHRGTEGPKLTLGNKFDALRDE